MSELLQHIRLQDIGGLIVAAGLKMANILCSLQPLKAYDNSVHMPLLPGADDVLVLDALSPMELHLLLVSVNRLVDHLEKTLTDSGSGLSLQHWISIEST
ncbi:hypothetical protein FJT64_000178 [Amphibalanus amphitrite]|uniref:Uncharacterized protein n=1 Tax=Amphibalanus amphitrite TaxID=1232801 RepID=A0A6A4VGK6_AMPAM|nr:hypothetical protein FJT64_000178 [Amphibalanus amphitrite]